MKYILPFLFLVCIGCTNTKKDTVDFGKFLDGQLKHFNFNGNVLIAEKGKIVFQQSYGFANYDTKRLLNDSSVFELASVSKQFTAMSILLLMEKGKLKLTDSLRQFFPELPYSGITIRHLLTHTSGLPDYESKMNEKWDRHKIAFNKNMIAFLATEKMPVNFQPGTRWEYSNTAFALLATIVEKVSGQIFSQFLSENIFTPLGMRHSRIYNTRRSQKDTIANYAYGFAYDDSLKKYFLPDSLAYLNFVIYLDGIQGDGCVNSTTADLLKWDRALKNHTLLSEATQNEMLKGQELMDSINKSFYGYGVIVGKNEAGNFIAHSGGWPGYTTFLIRYVDTDRTIIVLSNNNSNSPAIAATLERMMSGKTIEMPYQHKEIAMDSTAIDQFTGNYEGAVKIKLERRGEKLFRVMPNGDSLELKPESATKFFYSDDSDRQLEFEQSEKSKIKNTWLISFGVKTEFKKTE